MLSIELSLVSIIKVPSQTIIQAFLPFAEVQEEEDKHEYNESYGQDDIVEITQERSIDHGGVELDETGLVRFIITAVYLDLDLSCHNHEIVACHRYDLREEARETAEGNCIGSFWIQLQVV